MTERVAVVADPWGTLTLILAHDETAPVGLDAAGRLYYAPQEDEV